MSTNIDLNGTTWTLPDQFLGTDGFAYWDVLEAFYRDLGVALGFSRGLGLLSATSFTPGTGSKVFVVVPTGVTLPTNAIVQATSASDPTHWMLGYVTASSSGSLTITVTAANGGSAKTDWIIGNRVSVGDVPRWVKVDANFNAAHGVKYLVDTSGGTITATLAASPAEGDTIEFADFGQDWATNNLTIDANGGTIDGDDDLVCDVAGAAFALRFNGTEWTKNRGYA